MVLDEVTQRSWKRRIVEDALARIGGLRDARVAAVVPGPALGYRNRVEFTLAADDDGEPIVGLHAPAGASIVGLDRCLLQDDAANAVLTAARELLRHLRPSLPPVSNPEGAPRLVLRRSSATGDMLVVVVESGWELVRAEAFGHEILEACPRVLGVVRVSAVAGRRGGAKTESLAGSATLPERIGGIDFEVPATTFVQVNAHVGEALLEHATRAAGEVRGARVLELYGGIGAMGLTLASRGASATICEADAAAVACGRAASRSLEARERVQFVQDDVAPFVERCAVRPERVDVVLANPPRAGMGRRVASGITALGPRRIVVVSCDPATLARDAKVFVGGGYELDRVTPFDLFPQTPHVEVLATFRREG